MIREAAAIFSFLFALELLLLAAIFRQRHPQSKALSSGLFWRLVGISIPVTVLVFSLLFVGWASTYARPFSPEAWKADQERPRMLRALVGQVLPSTSPEDLEDTLGPAVRLEGLPAGYRVFAAGRAGHLFEGRRQWLLVAYRGDSLAMAKLYELEDSLGLLDLVNKDAQHSGHLAL